MKRELKIRLGNLELRECTYLCEPPSPVDYCIVKYTPKDDGTSESCFVISNFQYNSHEKFYEINFVGNRPLELKDDEKNIFWDLLLTGDYILNKIRRDGV